MSNPAKRGWFSDALGRAWCMEFTWGTAMRVKTLIKLNVEELIPKVDGTETSEGRGMTVLQSLLEDQGRLFDITWAVIQPQAEKEGISASQLADSFGADAFIGCAIALCEALEDFFPSPVRKAILRQAVKKGREAMEAAARRIDRDIGALDMEKMINEVPIPPVLLNNMSTGSQGSSASTPARSASVP